jgi:predicted dehydrogenase/nucleoside-diphosphate-sugar epimerase
MSMPSPSDNLPLTCQAPLRVAVIGCGAVTREFHLPVLAGHPGVELVALVDQTPQRAREMAAAYGVKTVLADAAELDRHSVDAAVVATPPYHHAPCCIDLAQRGVHVLVEKPMATNYNEAVEMVRAADEAGVVLSVALFRRLYPSTRMLRALIASEALGRPIGFDVESGGVYGWPLASLGNMRKDQSGGGVLIDIAAHMLDQLLTVLPGTADVLDYQDNALGGIETDCAAKLRIILGDHAIEGRLELSRTRNLRGTIQIRCQRGLLEVGATEPYSVSVKPEGLELVDSLHAAPRPYDARVGWQQRTELPGYSLFRAEIDDWLDAIRSGKEPYLSGRSALPAVRLIEQCYRGARPLVEPWVAEGLGPQLLASAQQQPRGLAVDQPTVPSVPCVREGNAFRRVLVTGASGFIGCRVAEILRLAEGWNVRAMVHNPGNASRLARLPVEMIQADMTSPSDVARAVEGCDAVVHCAIGTAYGEPWKIPATTVQGTRILAEKAREAGVRRFVHVSSMAVYGNDVRGVIDESTPLRPGRKDTYAQSKAAAEKALAAAADGRMPAVVLRLANIYGPYCPNLIVRPVRHLVAGALVFVGDPSIASNTVHVDNVAAMCVRALTAAEDRVAGQVFVLGQEDDYSWEEFFNYFGAAWSSRLRAVPPEEHARQAGAKKTSLVSRWFGSWYRGSRDLVRSTEFKTLGRKMLETDPIGWLPRTMLQKSPRFKRTVEKLLRAGEPAVYREPHEASAAGDGCLPTMYWTSVLAKVNNDKAHRVLGYEPVLSRQRAMALTLQWLESSQLIKIPASSCAPGK